MPLLIEYSAILSSLNLINKKYSYRKNERKIVAATIKKIQAPNQLAAVFPVSGSPELNLL